MPSGRGTCRCLGVRCFVLCYAVGLGLLATLTLSMGGGAAGQRAQVDVVQREQVGPYDIRTVAGREGAALSAWLRAEAIFDEAHEYPRSSRSCCESSTYSFFLRFKTRLPSSATWIRRISSSSSQSTQAIIRYKPLACLTQMTLPTSLE